MAPHNYVVSGATLGALSWAVCPLVSNHFEPFDTIVGFICGQLILSVGAVYIGRTSRSSNLLLGLLGAHVGQNVYSFTFGSGDQKAYFFILIFTQCIYLYNTI